MNVFGNVFFDFYCITVNISILQSQSQNSSGELGDVGDGSRLRSLHGMVDTTISCVCTCTVGSAQCSGCMVYGPSAMVAFFVLLLLSHVFLYYYRFVLVIGWFI